MEMKFASLLHTALARIGFEKEFAPPKSQDPADKLMHEYFVAAAMVKMGEDRKKIAKEMILDMKKKEADTLSAEAVKLNSTQKEVIIQSAHYNATLQCNKPVQRLDKDMLFVELVKLGVDTVTVTKAMDNATKASAPAQTLTVVPTHER
jgi:hypothetical protein